VLTADHGNAEDMAKRDKSGKPLRDKNGKVQTLTSHTLNPVSLLSSLRTCSSICADLSLPVCSKLKI
jgi:bisphosphoglycerate-independent phosphoglycerate mutase (AlkP superfamily)